MVHRDTSPKERGSAGLSSVLDETCWEGRTLTLGNVEFETGVREWSDWKHDQGRFFLLKPSHLLKAYARFWSGRAMPRNVVELGVWEGGSAVFWFEAFAPRKHVAIDHIVREDSEHFSSYVKDRGAADRLKTYWGVDQGDRQALREIVAREFGGPIDLVIDDASHIYEPTRASFETLFPYLRPRGLYIVEDWQWSYSDEPPPSLADAEPVSRLVHEAIDSVGRRGAGSMRRGGGESVKSVTVAPGFAAIEKGIPQRRERQ
jgi:predicted O-methyltransferase YrrM